MDCGGSISACAVLNVEVCVYNLSELCEDGFWTDELWALGDVAASLSFRGVEMKQMSSQRKL